MKYVKPTDPPQKVRMAAKGDGTCLQFPGLGIVLEVLRGDRRRTAKAESPR
jgi:hypothetical protein